MPTIIVVDEEMLLYTISHKVSFLMDVDETAMVGRQALNNNEA